MLVRKVSFSKSLVGATLLLLVATGILVACGGGDTTASTGSSGSTGSTNSAPQQNGNRAIDSGTIEKYDATSKALTIKKTDGTTVTFTTTNARIVKSQKISTQDLSPLLGTNGVRVSVTGQQGSDGTYTAQDLTVSDMTAMGNGTPPAGGPRNGTPPAGGPQNGTPPAGGPKGTPPAGMNGTPPANGGRRITLQNAKLQNNQLTGTDQAGKSVTVKLSDSTSIFKETTGTTDDLKAGQNVGITPARSQNGSSTSSQNAGMIVVGDMAQQSGAAG